MMAGHAPARRHPSSIDRCPLPSSVNASGSCTPPTNSPVPDSRALGAEQAHRVVHHRSRVGRVASLELAGQRTVDDTEAMALEQLLIVLGMDGEGHGFPDQAQRWRGTLSRAGQGLDG